MEYRASIDIAAPADRVWAAVTDIGSWKDWDPHVTKVEGTVAAGSKVTVHTTLSDRAFPVTVSELDPPRRMVWSSGMPLGMFRGARSFTFEEHDGTTSYTVHEVFSGWMLGMISRSMPDLQPSFDQHVAGLKAHVEAG